MDVDEICLRIKLIAKQTLLDMGSYVPTLYVATLPDDDAHEPHLHVGYIPEMPEDPLEKQQFFFAMGQSHGGRCEEKVLFVTLAGKAWITLTPVDQPMPRVRPSAHPNRKEVLAVMSVFPDPQNESNLTHKTTIYEIITTSKTLDLLEINADPVNEDTFPVQDLLLTSFLRGVRSVHSMVR
jgi:hypothetical protein